MNAELPGPHPQNTSSVQTADESAGATVASMLTTFPGAAGWKSPKKNKSSFSPQFRHGEGKPRVGGNAKGQTSP